MSAVLRPSRSREFWVLGISGTAVLALFAVTLMFGEQFYSPAKIWQSLAGTADPFVAFSIVDLRLPRAVMGLFAGAAFGLAGVTFQTLLRNPLASPDIIGISAGASAAAVFAIVILGLSDVLVSGFALLGALGAALVIFALSSSGGFAGNRMILIGIGLGAMLTSVTQWVLSKAAAWDLQAAMRWLTGSLNGATWRMTVPLVVAFVVFGMALGLLRRDLDLLRLGDDTARGLGVRLGAVRVALIACAVSLLAFATAAAGPIAFVAFMSGPIAVRLLRSGRPALLESALVGAALVLGADLVAQHLLPARYPVGVVTGLLGAPFLIYLLVQMNRGAQS